MQVYSNSYEKAINEIAYELKKQWPIDKNHFEEIKKKIASKYKLTRVPSNTEVLLALEEEFKEKVAQELAIKKTRSASGVVVVAAMTAPLPCPHKEGPCIYCPGGPKFGTPQSYTGYEPAAMRAIQYNFDPKKQVEARLKQLEQMGHSTKKVELIIMGGTFPSFPVKYQTFFIKGCFDAINGLSSSSIEEAISMAEKAKRRNVALTIETRPDYCKEEHVDLMLSYGTTRVEIGVQSIYEDVLKFVNRGHTVKESIDAIRIAKDAGLKVAIHIMPGLPLSSFNRDIEMFKVIFEDQVFKPDMIKVYPTLVVEGTKLYDLYKKGEYKALTDEEAIEIVAKALELSPNWIRFMRVQRDIPATKIVAGPKHGNLRELAIRRLVQSGRNTKEIRFREAGLRNFFEATEIKLVRTDYEASLGHEVFLEYVDAKTNTLFGYLRLRIPSEFAHRPEIKSSKAAIVRELKVVGRATPFGKVYSKSWQHRGLGASLLKEAERIALEDFDAHKVLVISAIGTREYYYKLGYEKEGVYVSRKIK
ncbi:MAG: tRNA uridine(34) 5-carboxymethylaminomethyl modification radical SAM/GNAT enzyme Elp3 [Thermoproteota archaeon]|nr:tRNA uridine(34) 5-carboxymethylaminomethyl modification radical SAM/GNAT enzyme Elp3 [Candidatus Brockarchaeota archaeon]MBO3768278.1 tRNA uridine(34) 5-carboxymethylaminomethyl modification radical SAM/GNAT enzyme Elp3 [Candidatus Brockarchaeota archaeon]MBO3801320.1 tRNA uridine(34) 5-carboxymethylaminomethyl modification radical SAM/GNAT enzyme Elp3 [Candidatus Brockarchaeota archaeon]